MTLVAAPDPGAFARDCAALGARRPVVHALPVLVTANLVANALHAVGASPVMAVLIDEVVAIHQHADAVVLTLGTPDRDRFALLRVAAQSAIDRGLPAVLDPVGVGASPLRREVARGLLGLGAPVVVRGNSGELRALAGLPSPGGSPIDGGGTPEAALWDLGSTSLEALAAQHTLLATGPTDTLWCADRGHRGTRGHAHQARVTGMGCALTALVAAFRVVNPDPFEASLHALWLANAAGERAGGALGPGSFAPAWLDALFLLTQSPHETFSQGESHV